MAEFVYRATDSAGKLIKGSMDARDEAALVNTLRGMGYLPFEVKKGSVASVSAGPDIFKRISGKRICARDLSNFTDGLASMLEAGLPLDRSLSILSELEPSPAMREVIEDVHKGISSGQTLAESFEKYPKVFPEIYISTVRSGEAGGMLESVFARLRKYMDESQKLKDEIRSALLYPLLLTVVGGAAVAVMVLFVVPRFAVIFEDSGSLMPLPTRALLFVSNLLANWWWMAALLSVAAFFYLRKKLKTDEGRLACDRLALKLPLIGEVLRKSAVSRFARTLGTLLQGGLPILEALSIAVKTMANTYMAKDVQPVIDGVRRGRGIAAPLKEAASFPPMAVHLLTVGEETGRLDEMLLRLADNYDRDIGTSIKRMLSLLEPLIILVMAFVVGFIVISLLLAIFSLNDMPV